MPVLVSHYTEHKQLDKDISFFGFLRMHYFNGDPHDSDYDTDMKLPFKTSCSGLIAHNAVSVPVPSLTVVICAPVQVVQPDFCSYYQSPFSHNYSEDIFQPPKAA